jgi:hypothetical protein
MRLEDFREAKVAEFDGVIMVEEDCTLLMKLV